MTSAERQQIQIDEAQAFLRALYVREGGPTEGYIELRPLGRNGEKGKREWIPLSRIGEESPELRRVLELNAAGTNHAYFGVAPRQRRGDGTAENVKVASALWADFDVKNGEAKPTLLRRIEELPPPPSLIVDTGGGYHAYWLLDEYVPVDGRFLRILQNLVAATGADPQAKDPARILRLPGSVNVKAERGNAPVQLVRFHHDVFYTLDDFSHYDKASRFDTEDLLRGQSGRGRSLTDKYDLNPLSTQRIPQGDRHIVLRLIASKLRGQGQNRGMIANALRFVRDNRCEEGSHPVTDQEIEDIVDWVCETYDPDLSIQSFTDMGNVERMVKLFGGTVTFNREEGEFYVFKGHRWIGGNRAADAHLYRMWERTISSMEEQLLTVEDEELREAYRRHIRKSRSNFAKKNAFAMLAEHPEVRFIRGREVTTNVFDSDPHLLGVPDGVVDLRTGELRPGRPEDFITKSTGVNPGDPEKATEWLAFLDDVTEGDEELQEALQILVGYCLTGDTRAHIFPVFYGPTRSGKSTFIEVIASIMGDYAVVVDQDVFLEGGRRSERERSLWKAVGARMVHTAESADGDKWATSRVKGLTGGDTSSGRALYNEAIDIPIYWKPMLSTNHLAFAPVDDDAFWERMFIIPFLNRKSEAEQDRALRGKLLREGSHILAWGIEGAMKFYKRGDVLRPKAVREAVQEAREKFDIVQQWMNERTIPGEGRKVLAKEAWLDFKEYRDEVGAGQTMQKSTFIRRLESRPGISRRTGAGGWYYFYGFSLRPREDDNEGIGAGADDFV